MILESSLCMSLNVILIFAVWVSLFVSSPKMSKCDGKPEIFCWLVLTLEFLSHLCVQSTELHGNGASTLCLAQKCGCAPFSLSHPLRLHYSPALTLQTTGREGRSVHTSQDDHSGLTYRYPAAINWQSFTQQQSQVKSTGISDWASDPALLLKRLSWDRARLRGQGWSGRDSAASYRFI